MTVKHTVYLNTRDGQSVSFQCGEDEDLVSAAAKAAITLPSTCRSGTCGTCSGTCSKGDYALSSHSDAALSAEQAEAGGILMCRTHPKGDLVVEVPTDLAHIMAGPAPELECTVVAIEDLGGQVMRLEIKALEGGASFEPGQYMELIIPGSPTSRAYSLSNAPNWDGTFEFLIRLQPNGKFSTWLKDVAKIGDKIHARGPQGSFVLQAGSLNPRRFVAGGTGLAPMLSMLRQMAAFGEMNDAHLYLGVNTEDDLFGQAQLDELKALLPNLRIDICVWKAKNGWQGFTGTPADALKRDLKNDLVKGLQPETYLCGPPGLVDATERAVTEMGVAMSSIFSEKFLPS